MPDDDIFDAVAHLVAVGQYLDELPGRPGIGVEDLQSRPELLEELGDRPLRRYYRRGSRSFVEAREHGWLEQLPPLEPAPFSAVEEAETLAGQPLPVLLRRLYLEVVNGGFGPGYGVLGVRGGHTSGRRTAVDLLHQRRPDPEPGPVVPFVLCDWGCGITTVIDLSNGLIWGSDPNPSPPGVPFTFPQHMTIDDWLTKWLDGRLYQPWLRQDETTGEWRGATDAETEAMLLEAFGPDGPPD
jgi:hypothetical protein